MVQFCTVDRNAPVAQWLWSVYSQDTVRLLPTSDSRASVHVPPLGWTDRRPKGRTRILIHHRSMRLHSTHTGYHWLEQSWLTPMDHAMHCVLSHHYAVHKAGRSVRLTGDGRWSMLTTLGDDQRAVAKLFLVQRLEKSSRVNYTNVWRYSNFVFVW